MKRIVTACVLSVLFACTSSYGMGDVNSGFSASNSSSGNSSSGKSLSQAIVIPDSDDPSVVASSKSDSEFEEKDLPKEQFWDENTQFAPLVNNLWASDEEVIFDADAVVADARSRGETIMSENLPRKRIRTENNTLKNRQKKNLSEGQTAITKYFHDMVFSDMHDSQSVLGMQGSQTASAGSSIMTKSKRRRKKKELPVSGPLDAFLIHSSDAGVIEDNTSPDAQISQGVFGTRESRAMSSESAEKSGEKPRPSFREVTLAYNSDGSRITGYSPKKATDTQSISSFRGTHTKKFILSELSQTYISAKDVEVLREDVALQHVDLPNTLATFKGIGGISDHVITAFISENTLHNFDPWDRTRTSCPENLQRTLGTKYERGVTALIIPDGLNPDLLNDQLQVLEMENPEYSKVSVIVCENFCDWSGLTSLRSLFAKFGKVPYIVYNRDKQRLTGKYYSNKQATKWRLGYNISLSIFGSALKTAE